MSAQVNNTQISKSHKSHIRDRVETTPRQELEKLQVERLRDGIDRVSRLVPFYRERLNDAGVRTDSIRFREDLARLPFTTKHDLRDNYPLGLLAVPRPEIARVHASSGTTGKPTVVAYSRNDLDLWSEIMARAYAAAGVSASDVVHNAYGYGLFTGGLGFHYGAERLGLTTVPVSGGMTERQVLLLKDFGAHILGATPSYALNIAEVAQSMGVDLHALSLRYGCF